jgi:D-alanyl-lipoteichoic acid acyltransferase DltB (MBOAT superfamily)
MQHENIKHYFDVLLKSKWFNPVLGVFVTLGLFCFSTAVFAEDLLKDAMPALKENFGTGSAVVKIIYLVDIISSVLIYIKTKDYKIAGSVLITLIYLTYTLNNMVFKGI